MIAPCAGAGALTSGAVLDPCAVTAGAWTSGAVLDPRAGGGASTSGAVTPITESLDPELSVALLQITVHLMQAMQILQRVQRNNRPKKSTVAKETSLPTKETADAFDGLIS